MSRATSQPVPSREWTDYGSFVVCPACSRQSDIWAEHCDCGTVLLPDERHVKLAKSGGTPRARMGYRATRLEASKLPADHEQALRDRTALRVDTPNPDVNCMPGIVKLLVMLGRLDEACVEAEASLSALDPAKLSGLGGLVLRTAVHELALRLHSTKDPRAEAWLRRVLGLEKDVMARLALESALIGLFIEQGRQDDALQGFAAADAELAAARKKTSKNAVVNTFGSGDAFAVGRWGQATDALERFRAPVLEASTAVVVTAGRQALADVGRLEQSGDVVAARDAAVDGIARLAPTIQRLTAVATGLSAPERRRMMDPVGEVSRTLEKERKRLSKLAKRS